MRCKNSLAPHRTLRYLKHMDNANKMKNRFAARIAERMRKQNEAVAKWNKANPNALRNSRTIGAV